MGDVLYLSILLAICVLASICVCICIYMIKGGLLLQLRKVISLVKSDFSLLLTSPILFGGDELSETLFCMPLPLTVPHGLQHMSSK